ncbi:MAG: hypothetical protein LBU46_04560 [Candidatus Accumulibacter sp.]|jgi:predicted nucleic acid-binding protein|nr:hypothetical protein [Accumulibacter sp.]
MMRIALDTNILAYAEGLGDEARCQSAVALVENLAGVLAARFNAYLADFQRIPL